MIMGMYAMLYQWIHNLVAALKTDRDFLVRDATLFHSVATPMNFVFRAASILQGVKISKPSTAVSYTSVFDFCAGRCRHNSESVVHENAYLSDFHHCFSLPSNSSGANYTQLEARLGGINVVIGKQGESCDSACKSYGQSCVLNKLLVLNQCDIMRKYMGCKGACLASIGTDQPAEVVEDAPRHLEHACILEHNHCFPVMVHFGIPGDFAHVLSVCVEILLVS
uniref:SREBP regulating gene protein n=1 Tax=Salix viminalis TaxID=40686 RepID=A0A6N2M1U0_SALVM